ncbi:hypothetical protein EDB92DRAFT_869376 [Lactarius akahatsu]|uniref:Uncharacterized protein n=1 Tax=Lactarius akahatsu TaxID=416441 RepID=A0AAD4LJA5_9AGAM|nr:hypothetical protein EDB92DRAFT_869376 [Lactarius akahatsu]
MRQDKSFRRALNLGFMRLAACNPHVQTVQGSRRTVPSACYSPSYLTLGKAPNAVLRCQFHASNRISRTLTCFEAVIAALITALKALRAPGVFGGGVCSNSRRKGKGEEEVLPRERDGTTRKSRPSGETGRRRVEVGCECPRLFGETRTGVTRTRRGVMDEHSLYSARKRSCLNTETTVLTTQPSRRKKCKSREKEKCHRE